MVGPSRWYKNVPGHCWNVSFEGWEHAHFYEGEEPIAMRGSRFVRCGKHSTKWGYSYTVLKRYVRMKKLTILEFEDYQNLRKDKNGNIMHGRHWHNFPKAEDYLFDRYGRSLSWMCEGEAYVNGVLRNITNDQRSALLKLRKLVSKIDALD